MEKQYVFVHYIHYGDDWHNEYSGVFNDEDEANRFEYEHRKEYENVSGIKHIEFYHSFRTEEELKDLLTVSEYERLISPKPSFYGGENGIDYVCFDKEMKVVASGKEEEMLRLHNKFGYAVGELKAVRFVRGKD